MLNETNIIITEDYIRKIIRKELEKLSSFSNVTELTKKEITTEEILKKESRAFLGKDNDLKTELEKTFFIKEKSEILIVSELSLKNLYNLSNGIYEDEFEEKIIKQVLNGDKVILIEEGLEYLQYNNIPKKLVEKYENYLKKLKEYGIKIQKKGYFLDNINNAKDIYTEKLLDLKTMMKLASEGMITVKLSEKTIITSSAMDYAKENNIMVIKRR